MADLPEEHRVSMVLGGLDGLDAGDPQNGYVKIGVVLASVEKGCARPVQERLCLVADRFDTGHLLHVVNWSMAESDTCLDAAKTIVGDVKGRLW